MANALLAIGAKGCRRLTEKEVRRVMAKIGPPLMEVESVPEEDVISVVSVPERQRSTRSRSSRQRASVHSEDVVEVAEEESLD